MHYQNYNIRNQDYYIIVKKPSFLNKILHTFFKKEELNESRYFLFKFDSESFKNKYSQKQNKDERN